MAAAPKKIVKQPNDTAGQDDSGQREDVSYIVVMDGPSTPTAALTASIPDGAAVPAYYAPHSDPDDGLVVTSKTAERINNSLTVFVVKVTYSTLKNEWTEPKPPGDNVKWNKTVDVTGVEIVEGVNRDASKKPIKNSFGDIYPADTDKTYYDEQVTVSFSTDTVDVAAIGACRGKINSDPVTLTVTKKGASYTKTFAAKTLKCGNASYRVEVTPDGVGAWNVTIPLIYRSQKNQAGTEVGWTRQIVDKGFRYLDSGGKTVLSETEVLLDGTGHKLGSSADAILLPVDIEDAVAFAGMLTGV